MIVQVLSLRDRVAETFGRPVFTPAIGVLLREVTDEVRRVAADNNLFNHPGDFEIMHLGVFDDQTGLFELFPMPRLICGCAGLRGAAQAAPLEGA